MTKNQIQETVSMREIQRNYKRLFDKVRRTKKPLFLGPYTNPQVVILDVDYFKELEEKAEKQSRAMTINWKKIYKDLDEIAQKGRQGVNLAEFIKNDRENH